MAETMNREADYQEFDAVPEGWTYARWGKQSPVSGDREILNEADDFKWSGDAPPPAVGAKVHCYMNGFGPAVVTGYFVEYGWLGVLVKFAKPPKWWVKQTRDRGENPKTTKAHMFGIDLQPRKVKAAI
jgi:hypothetical protein